MVNRCLRCEFKFVYAKVPKDIHLLFLLGKDLNFLGLSRPFTLFRPSTGCLDNNRRCFRYIFELRVRRCSDGECVLDSSDIRCYHSVTGLWTRGWIDCHGTHWPNGSPHRPSRDPYRSHYCPPLRLAILDFENLAKSCLQNSPSTTLPSKGLFCFIYILLITI